MELGNTTGIFRLADAGQLSCLALGLLLGGCSRAAHRETPPQAPPSRPVATTGIAACDAYLNSYLACHRVAGIYGPDTAQTHYQAMRASLLQDANDPHVRPYLTNRCVGLTQQLAAVLKERACVIPPASIKAAPH
jgi:hypothetical protein